MSAHPLGLVMGVWRGDVTLAIERLEGWRKLYPELIIQVREDGSQSRALIEACARLQAGYSTGPRLKLAKSGGAWLEETIRLGLSTKAAWVIRADPDALPLRQFGPFPQNQGVLVSPAAGLNGGCLLLERTVLERVHNHIASDRSRFTGWGYARYGIFRRPGEDWSADVLANDDAMLEVLLKECAAPLTPWEELDIRFRPLFSQTEISHSSAAVIHPVGALLEQYL